MSETIAEFQSRLDQRMEEHECALLQAELDHAFNWLWYQELSGPPLSNHDLEEHTERMCRKAFFHGVKSRISGQVTPVAKTTTPQPSLLFALFAFGVVIGMAIGFTTFFLNVSPN